MKEKKLLLSLLSVICTGLSAVTVTSCESTKFTEGLEFELSEDGTSYEVTGIGTATDAEIIIPSTYNKLPVTSIGYGAFYNCSSLTIIEIPKSVISIGNFAFENCSSLTSIEMPDSVTSVGEGAFQLCRSLTSIEIPKSVTSISNHAFFCCSSLENITIPDSVTSISEDAFNGCSSLESIVVDSNNKYYDSRNNCNAIIDTLTNTLIKGCKNTIIPNNVKCIGNYAFSNCSSLESIIIPKSVTSIGEGAFDGCSSLTSIEIPDSVTSIDEGVFWGCRSLTSIIIPESVTNIGGWTFHFCSSLTDVYYTGTEQQWNNILIHSSGNENLTNATIHYNYKG